MERFAALLRYRAAHRSTAACRGLTEVFTPQVFSPEAFSRQEQKMTTVMSPKQVALSLTELWSPRVIGEVDDAYINFAKVQGSLAWHSHEL